MFLILFIFLECRAQDSVGKLQINETLTLLTNFTEQAPSIILSFILPDQRTSPIGCFVSQSSLPQIDIDSLSDFSSEFAYDLHGIQSNSNIQLIGFPYHITLYLSCQSDWFGEVSYELSYKEDYYNSGCVNDCQGYNTTGSTSQSYCINDYCECQTNQLGNFCQLPATFILSGNQQTIKLKPRQWKFYYYLFSSTSIVLQSSLKDQSIMFSLALQDTPQLEIPNKQNAFVLSNATNIQDLMLNLVQYTEATILYIGLLNTGNTVQNFNFTLVTSGSIDYATIERNRIIIISVGSAVGALLVLTFLTSMIRARRMQAHLREQIRTRKTKSDQGFSQDFIKSYFGELLYSDLVKAYPGLQQFEECVICLESIKNGKTKQLRHCSVTPCFHVFHLKCLSQWLEKQRNCPFCRSEYTKVQIQSQYPWMQLTKSNRNKQPNNYISNLKHNNTDTSPEQLNESQQELVGKIGGVQEA